MSDFSSWGVTSDLKLKPEITAPGGDIYSTLPNGLYGKMSGTSMASPHMAGAAAVMQQYISENRDGINMTAEQRTSLFNALMMSTAVPVQDENGIPYSSRKQGAGLVQLQNAMKSDVFLLNSDNSRPKAKSDIMKTEISALILKQYLLAMIRFNMSNNNRFDGRYGFGKRCRLYGAKGKKAFGR